MIFTQPLLHTHEDDEVGLGIHFTAAPAVI